MKAAAVASAYFILSIRESWTRIKKKKKKRTNISKTPCPTIILSNGQNDAAIIVGKGICKEFRASPDIVILKERQKKKIYLGYVRPREETKLTGSLQFPPGARLHLSWVSCMSPCSPAPPTVSGLQLDSCKANDTIMIGSTNVM